MSASCFNTFKNLTVGGLLLWTWSPCGAIGMDKQGVDSSSSFQSPKAAELKQRSSGSHRGQDAGQEYYDLRFRRGEKISLNTGWSVRRDDIDGWQSHELAVDATSNETHPKKRDSSRDRTLLQRT